MIFPPAFVDSSSCWNTNHNQLQQIGSNIYNTTTPPPAGPDDGGSNNNNQEGLMATDGGSGGGGCDGGGRGAGDGDGGSGENSKPMSMSERARLVRVPQPEPGLNCPRCDSTSTKFCYFNNYSLTQPRHLCRACRRYWTRGGTLRNVPYHCHAKRSTKPKASSAGAAETASSVSTAMTSSTTACTTGTATMPPALQYSMFGSAPPHGRFTDSFDRASLGLSFPSKLLFADGGAYAADSGVRHHHQGNGNDMEQWAAAQMQSFPVLHAVDDRMARPPAAAMPTTMAAMKGMFHLGLQSGGNGDDGGDHHFHQHHQLRQCRPRETTTSSSRITQTAGACMETSLMAMAAAATISIPAPAMQLVIN